MHAMTGKPGTELTSTAEVSLPVRTEHPAEHGVYFNRGVIASQAYAERFHNRAPDKVPNDEAWRWLLRGLAEALLAFIGQAGDATWELHGTFYEFQHPDVLAAFGVAQHAGAGVHLIVDGTNPKNTAAVTAAGIDGLIDRWWMNAKIPHNKFLVASHQGKPVAAWTGSTNITINGIFGQSNVGHSVADADLASAYLEYWQQLVEDPKPSDLNDWVDDHSPLPKPWPTGITPVSSPHTRPDALERYATLFGDAAQLVCGTFPFTLDSRFGKLLPGSHTALRRLLFEDAKAACKASAAVTDPKTTIVAGAFLPVGAFGDWAAELQNPLSNNVEYIHSKYLLIDPLGPDPIVVSGSANFSVSSTTANDENMLVLRGNTAVAEIYLTEFLRLFDHYRFRYSLSLQPTELSPGPESKVHAAVTLDPTNKWWQKYYEDEGRTAQRLLMSGHVK